MAIWILMVASVRGAEWVVALNALKKRCEGAASVQFHALVNTYRETDPSPMDPLVRVLDYKGKGAMFAFEGKQSGRDTSLILGNGAYDGVNYQHRLGPHLHISKGLPLAIPELYIADSIFQPFLSFKLMREGNPEVPEAVMTLAQLSSPEQWDKILSNAHEPEIEGPPEDRYVVLTFPGFSWDRKVSAKVWFSLARGGYPMRWQMREVSREQPGPFGYDYEVTELGEVNAKGVVFYYPKVAKLQQYCGNQKPCAWHSIETSEVQMNHLEDDEPFTLDPSEFEGILDLDTNQFISVPK